MYERAMLIYNGNAGNQKTAEMLGMVTGILAQHIRELALIQSLEPGDGEKICRERGGEFQLVLIMGGDGTVHECVNGLAVLQNPPAIGILPAGTCNDFARSLNLSADPVQAAEQLMAGNTERIDVGVVGERVFTNFLGIGLIAEASENINADLKGMFGRISYYISTLQTVVEAEPFRYWLETDEGVQEDEAVMIYVSNGRSLGTKSLPFREEALRDGMLDVLIIREAGLPLLKELLARKGEGEWEPKNDSIQYFQTTSLTLKTEQPMKIDTDGETYLETPVTVSVRPQALRFLIGK
ncbi:diacylglycerol/lipid kinase family protein [Paenibacillus dakarensis]|uniref:diacylglycerol/lipid kinase family protein n=1 Tax=Paenibacillus dakarensis TaxID=1527293 RepID=UPI0006D5A9D5|nr:diacylglycerol kinase family protein [Paenibacillus dakarensis]